eukprot:5541303-Prymnesium_polylepis.1
MRACSSAPSRGRRRGPWSPAARGHFMDHAAAMAEPTAGMALIEALGHRVPGPKCGNEPDAAWGASWREIAGSHVTFNALRRSCWRYCRPCSRIGPLFKLSARNSVVCLLIAKWPRMAKT